MSTCGPVGNPPPSLAYVSPVPAACAETPADPERSPHCGSAVLPDITWEARPCVGARCGGRQEAPPDDEEVRLVSTPVTDCARLFHRPDPRRRGRRGEAVGGHIDALWSRQCVRRGREAGGTE